MAKKIKNNKKIGFIGQGWIGKHYADDFENRGFSVIRYSLEEPYIKNEEKIKQADIVFIAVPTPTTPAGFDASILKQVIKKVGRGKTAVIKSTVLPGTTESIQKENPDIYVLHAPEFLTEATAAYDAANPLRNIIGLPVDSPEHRARAQEVMAVLPPAPYELICSAPEAEIIKYGGNNWFYFKVVFINLLYDLAQKLGCRWDVIKQAMAADPRIGSSHLNPIHQSGTSGGEARPNLKSTDLHLEPGHKSGRGAGGHCFIKDFAAFYNLYKKIMPTDKKGIELLKIMQAKNIDLLVNSGKDLDLLAEVYGDQILKQK